MGGAHILKSIYLLHTKQNRVFQWTVDIVPYICTCTSYTQGTAALLSYHHSKDGAQYPKTINTLNLLIIIFVSCWPFLQSCWVSRVEEWSCGCSAVQGSHPHWLTCAGRCWHCQAGRKTSSRVHSHWPDRGSHLDIQTSGLVAVKQDQIVIKIHLSVYCST